MDPAEELKHGILVSNLAYEVAKSLVWKKECVMSLRLRGCSMILEMKAGRIY